MAKKIIGINEDGSVNEAELEARDTQVNKDVRYWITEKRELARQLKAEAEALEKGARLIEQNVRAGKWWELEGLLEKDVIESLCEIDAGANNSEYLEPIV